MAPRKEKPIFKGLVMALTGDLGGQWTETNIARWVRLREGALSQDLDESVTHLICSDKEFKRRGSGVRAALKRGDRNCKVVTKDWLEDCMTEKRKLPEKPYSLAEVLKKERAKERKLVKIQKGMEEAERAVNQNLYHHYHDGTFFRYDVTISREDDGARYIISIFESNAKPHMYWFCAKFYKRKGDTQPHFYRPSETPGRFAREFAHFEAFFHKKTGVPWARRLLPPPGPVGEMLFRYLPPTGGKPVGYVPPEFIPADLETELVTVTDTTTTGDSKTELDSTTGDTELGLVPTFVSGTSELVSCDGTTRQLGVSHAETDSPAEDIPLVVSDVLVSQVWMNATEGL